MKKPNETRFKHNFVIAAVLAIFLLATGCPNTNDNLGGKEKPPTGGTDTETPKPPDQTTPETPSTEGEASDAAETAEEGDKTVQLTIKDLTKTVDGYAPTNEAPYNTKGKVVKASAKTDEEAIAKLKAKVAKELVKLNQPRDYHYKLFNKDGSAITEADYADGSVLTVGMQDMKTVKVIIKHLSSANAQGLKQMTGSPYATGKTIRAKVPVSKSGDTAAVAAALKMALSAFLETLNKRDKVFDYALLSSADAVLTDANYVNDAELHIGKKGKERKVKVTIKKGAVTGGPVAINAFVATKKFDAVPDTELVTTFYDKEIETDYAVDLSNATEVSTALAGLIEDKFGLSGGLLKPGAGVGVAIVNLPTVATGTAATAKVDPANGSDDGIANGKTYYLIKQVD